MRSLGGRCLGRHERKTIFSPIQEYDRRHGEQKGDRQEIRTTYSPTRQQRRRWKEEQVARAYADTDSNRFPIRRKSERRIRRRNLTPDDSSSGSDVDVIRPLKIKASSGPRRRHIMRATPAQPQSRGRRERRNHRRIEATSMTVNVAEHDLANDDRHHDDGPIRMMMGIRLITLAVAEAATAEGDGARRLLRVRRRAVVRQ